MQKCQPRTAGAITQHQIKQEDEDCARSSTDGPASPRARVAAGGTAAEEKGWTSRDIDTHSIEKECNIFEIQSMQALSFYMPFLRRSVRYVTDRQHSGGQDMPCPLTAAATTPAAPVTPLARASATARAASSRLAPSSTIVSLGSACS